MTSLPLLKRTRVILRRAEFGFFGVIVRTCRHTPRFCGQRSSTGDLENFRFGRRRLRTSWLIVGIFRFKCAGIREPQKIAEDSSRRKAGAEKG